MTKKEKMELLLARVPEEQKEAFLAVVKKHNIQLSEEETKAAASCSNEVSDEELDHAAGGCCGGTPVS